ncbi:hypothetical protein AOLI_G00217000 [Acnodon oligacanthus]
MSKSVERTRCIGCEEHRLVEKQRRCHFRLQCATHTHYGADIRLSPRMHCGEQHVVCNPRVSFRLAFRGSASPAPHTGMS